MSPSLRAKIFASWNSRRKCRHRWAPSVALLDQTEGGNHGRAAAHALPAARLCASVPSVPAGLLCYLAKRIDLSADTHSKRSGRGRRKLRSSHSVDLFLIARHKILEAAVRVLPGGATGWPADSSELLACVSNSQLRVWSSLARPYFSQSSVGISFRTPKNQSHHLPPPFLLIGVRTLPPPSI